MAFGFYALALLRLERYAAHAARRRSRCSRSALATRVALVPVPPSLSGDVYRYMWEGRVAAAGGNPYRQSPRRSALAPLRDRAM